jgi:hypothetical protein
VGQKGFIDQKNDANAVYVSAPHEDTIYIVTESALPEFLRFSTYLVCVEQPGPFDVAASDNDGKLLKFLQYPPPGYRPRRRLRVGP